MKAVLVVVVLVGAMLLLGWITFSMNGQRPTVSANPDVIGHDVEAATEATKDVTRKAVDEVRRTDVDIDVDRRPTSAE